MAVGRLSAMVALLGLALALVAAAIGGASDSRPKAGATLEEVWEEAAWAPLTLLTVVDAGDQGAVGDGEADDTAALQRAIDALPEAGGVLWFPAGRTYRTTDVLRVAGDHVKLWAPDGQAGIVASTGGQERRQALVVDGARGVGLFGLTFDSDVDRRRSALEDSAIVLDGAEETELVGLEISGSSSAAIMVYGRSTRTWVVGNDINDNWADAVHFTDGSRQAWVWDNVILNRAPTLGDDGIACVTYGSGQRCGAMEWWGNRYLGGGWGRGLAIVGGDDLDLHDNVVMDTAAAGILVASEPSYDTPGSDAIRIENNLVCRAGHTVPHPGILISGLDGPITAVVVSDNDVVDSHVGQSFRAEGEVVDLVERRTSETTDRSCSTEPAPGAGRGARVTSVLATRDVSFAPESSRPGLHRIHVRSSPGGGFEQRLEYVVAGPPAAVEAWLPDRSSASVRFRSQDPEADADTYVVVRTGSPLTLPSSLRGVGFEELRAEATTLPDLWEHLDEW